MIGTHNSLTACPARNSFFNLVPFLWRCQTEPLSKQLREVHFFDIRIRFDKKGSIVYCHGLVDLAVDVPIDLLIRAFHSNNKKCRIVLERGKHEREFRELIARLTDAQYGKDVISHAIIKKGWKTVYGEAPILYDYSYVPVHSDRGFWYNLLHFKLSTPKRWARKHNPIITQLLKKSKTIHFMDYYK